MTGAWDLSIGSPLESLSDAGTRCRTSGQIDFGETAGSRETRTFLVRLSHYDPSRRSTMEEADAVRTNDFDNPPKGTSTLTIPEIGCWYTPLPALVGSVSMVRAGSPDLVPDADYARAHERLYGVLQFAQQSADGLGSRLARTGVYDNPFRIEHRIRALADDLVRSFVFMHLGIREGRDQRPLPASMYISALALRRIGEDLAAIPPTAEPQSQSALPAEDVGANRLKPLTGVERDILREIWRAPKGSGVSGKNIVNELDRTTVSHVQQNKLTGHIRKMRRKGWDIPNDGSGYYLSGADRSVADNLFGAETHAGTVR